MLVCTIVARNYVAQARVLADSYALHHGGRRLAVLVVDAEVGDPFDASGEPFDLVRPSQLPLPDDEFRIMAAIYDVTELSTAVKPALLRLLLDRGEPVCYLDPDIEIFAPLDEVEQLAREHGIVLIPHALEPMPDDGLKPTPEDIESAGTYNLGFIAVAPEASRFLEWWDGQLRRDCLIAFDEGLFVDQRLIDSVPQHYDHTVLRDPSYDVAYWNLHERNLAQDEEGRFTVEGRPLRFFHFSGYDPAKPHLLSKHQGGRPRILLSERPAIAAICAHYGRRLREHGHDELRFQPYGFARAANGFPLDVRARRAFRDALLAGERDLPDPFEPDEADAFVAWLRAAPDDGPVSRYLRVVWKERLDLQRAFPDLSGPSGASFLEWLASGGVVDPPIPEEFAPARSAEHWSRNNGPWGVNIAGYVRAELGIGEAARLLILALREAQIPYSVTPYGDTANRQDVAFDDWGTAHGDYGINVICVNADRLPKFIADVGPDFVRDRYSIGLWFWEVEDFPEVMQRSSALVDEIWVASSHAAHAIAPVVDKPVLIVPFPIPKPDPPERTKADFGIPESYTFLFTFDFNSVLDRKNPLGLIDAFDRAFAPGEGPTLVIKTINGHIQTEAAERLRAAIDDRRDVILLDRYLASQEQQALTNVCDAYVSLHRSEGLGLTMAEAMSLGKPVIATGYSGNTEFMRPWNSYLVPYTLVPIPEGCDPYPAGSRWADPDLDIAAAFMRRVFENREEAAAKGQRAMSDIKTFHTVEETGRFLRRRLRMIRDRPGDARRPSTDGFGAMMHLGVAASPLAAAASAIERGPLQSQRPLVRPVQRAIRRVLKSHTEYQQRTSMLLVQALTDVQERLSRIGGDVERLDRFSTRVEQLLERHDLGAIRDDVQEIANELNARIFLARPELLQATDPHGRVAIGVEADATAPASPGLYVGFEDVFRGSQELIRERQRVYLPYLAARAPVVDLGSGRGEMLDLLSGAGVDVIGVDADEGMVRVSRDKGHRVELADAVDFLAAQPDESLGAVFSAQFIEHIAYDRLLELLRIAHAKLVRGGVFIAETVNPYSVKALKAFWVDPTHEKPIFPEVAVFLCSTVGFASPWILFPHGTGDLEQDRVTEGEYAVLAVKPDESPPVAGMAADAKA